ncbi:MAG: iron ABC transporter permease, partial [Butyrivibrio sp.]|nr:iron ABC transporter permease [Butyrivibrio sp.]
MTNFLEKDLRKIYRRHSIQNAVCISVLVIFIIFLGVLMMTIGNTNYSVKEVFAYLIGPETKGAAYTIK